jgi:transcription termination/antitermination protein NusA
MTTKMPYVAGPRLQLVEMHTATPGLQLPQPSRECALHEIPGVLGPMLAAFGDNGINSVEDLAACATDDLLGWTERSGRGVIVHPGIFEGMEVSRTQCDAMILHARVRLGWIEPSSLNS